MYLVHLLRVMATPLATRDWWWCLSKYHPPTPPPTLALSSQLSLLVLIFLTFFLLETAGDSVQSVFLFSSHSLGTFKLWSHCCSSVSSPLTQSQLSGLTRGSQVVSWTGSTTGRGGRSARSLKIRLVCKGVLFSGFLK